MTLRAAGVALLVIACLVALTLLQLLPYYPADLVGWAILVGVGTPALVLLELAGEALVEPTPRRGTKATFPGGRLGALLVVGVVVTGLVLLWPFVAHHFRSLSG